MSHKIDERKENIQKIKKDIENTQANYEFAEDIIDSVSGREAAQRYVKHNERRLEAIESMVEDVKERVKD